MTPEVSRDLVGERTLESFSETPRFNRWLLSKLSWGLGKTVLEIGSGIGNLTELIQAERIYASDFSQYYVDALKEKFAGRQDITPLRYDVLDANTGSLLQLKIDSILCSNVLEHVPEPDLALRNLFTILQPGGRLHLLVPFSPVLYCELDRQLGHYCRYTRHTLRERVVRAGFAVEKLFVFNFFGGVGWFVNGKLRGHHELDPDAVLLFDKLVSFFSDS